MPAKQTKQVQGQTTIEDKATIKAVLAAIGVAPDELPALVVVQVPKAGRPANRCQCGCGNLTKATWAPGHDAKHKATLYVAIRKGGAEGAKAKKELADRGWPLPTSPTPKATEAKAEPEAKEEAPAS